MFAASLEGGLLLRTSLLQPHRRPLCGTGRHQVLDGLPNPPYCDPAIGEPFDRSYSRQAVPDLDQPAARPLVGQRRELLLVSEGFSSFAPLDLLERREEGDVVL